MVLSWAGALSTSHAYGVRTHLWEKVPETLVI